MKIQGAKKVHYDSGPNMTPLVDVVMVILIFLMLTGSFGAATHFMPSTMPLTKEGKGKNDKPVIDAPKLDIVMSSADSTTWVARTPNNEVFTNGIAAGSGRTLVQALSELKKKYEDPSKLQVMIAPHYKARYEHIIQLYQMCMEAELPKIGFKAART